MGWTVPLLKGAEESGVWKHSEASAQVTLSHWSGSQGLYLGLRDLSLKLSHFGLLPLGLVLSSFLLPLVEDERFLMQLKRPCGLHSWLSIIGY